MNCNASFKYKINTSGTRVKMGLAARLEWLEGLYRLYKAALPLTTALELLAEGYKGQTVDRFSTDLADKLRQGYSLTEAIRHWRHDFATSEMALLESGESSARLGGSLKAVTALQRQRLQTRRSIVQALLYPVVTFALAVLVALFILLVIVPQFQSFYYQLDRQPPHVTQLLITVSSSLQRLDWVNLIDGLIVAEGVLAMSAFYPLFHRIGQWLCRLPFVSKFVHDYWQLTVLRSLSLCLAKGMELPKAFELVSDVFRQSYISSQLIVMLNNLHNGSSLTEVLNHQTLFDYKTVRMLVIGEASGELSTVVTNTADYAGQRFEHELNQFRQWVEPVMVGVVGVMTGALLLALYLPLFKLGSTL